MNIKTLKKYLSWTLFMLATIALGYAIGATDLMDYLLPEKVSGINLMVSLVLFPFWILGIHELGHLLTGLAQGFRFSIFVVGPLGIKRADDDKITVYFNKDFALYGGIAATQPTGSEDHIRKSFSNILIAGPLASLTAGIIQLIVSVATDSAADFFLVASGLGHMAIFAGTTIPAKSGLFFTDRKRWQRLRTPGREADAELGLLHVMHHESKHKHLKDCDLETMTKVLNDPDDFCQFFGHYYLWKYHQEHNNESQGKPHYDSLLERKDTVPKSFWAMLEIPE